MATTKTNKTAKAGSTTGASSETKDDPNTLLKYLNKTRLCTYHKSGRCRAGANCAYAHVETELQNMPDLHKTQLCTAYKAGNCNKADCRYAHGQEELRPSEFFFKRTICKFYSQGKCQNGKTCRFAHGLHELRGPEITDPTSTTVSDSSDGKVALSAKKEKGKKRPTQKTEKLVPGHLMTPEENGPARLPISDSQFNSMVASLAALSGQSSGAMPMTPVAIHPFLADERGGSFSPPRRPREPQSPLVHALLEASSGASTNLDSDETDETWNLQPNLQTNPDIYGGYPSGLGLSKDPMKIALRDEPSSPPYGDLDSWASLPQLKLDMPGLPLAPGLEPQQAPVAPLSSLFSNLLSNIADLDSKEQLPAVQAIAMQMAGALSGTEEHLYSSIPGSTFPPSVAGVGGPPGISPTSPEDASFLLKLGSLRGQMEGLLVDLQKAEGQGPPQLSSQLGGPSTPEFIPGSVLSSSYPSFVGGK